MLDRELRKIRDRKFVPYIQDKHWLRAFALSSESWASFDLFPPIKGYRAVSSRKKTYYVSIKRQQRDWAKSVLKRDGFICTNCGSRDKLEAHHIWPQQSSSHLRYVLKNGITLCRTCHAVADRNFEITPNQFKWVTQECDQINSNIERDDFWEYFTAGNQKGRLMLYNILPHYVDVSFEELNWYLSQAKLPFIKEAAQCAVYPDFDLELNKEMIRKIKEYHLSK